MELTSGIFSETFLWIVGGLYTLILFYALSIAPWRRVLKKEQFNIFLGCCVALTLLWSMRVEVNQALTFHLLGVTLLTLMFGWSFGIIGSSIVLAAVTFNIGSGWEMFPVNAITTGVLPVTLTLCLLVLVRSLLPKNFFIYVLGNGFVTGGLVALASGYLTVGLVVMSGAYTLQQLAEGFMPFFPLMFMPEAFLNGWIITILVLFRPHWVYSFDDDLYLKGK